jgi:hypothetical protein
LERSEKRQKRGKKRWLRSSFFPPVFGSDEVKKKKVGSIFNLSLLFLSFSLPVSELIDALLLLLLRMGLFGRERKRESEGERGEREKREREMPLSL